MQTYHGGGPQRSDGEYKSHNCGNYGKKIYIYVYNYIVHGGWLYSHGSFSSSLVKPCQTQSNHMVCSFVGYHRDFPAARLLSLRQLSLNLVGYLCIAEHFFWDKPWSKRGMIMGIQFITIPYQMNSWSHPKDWLVIQSIQLWIYLVIWFIYT
jgi:hypothetical protein